MGLVGHLPEVMESFAKAGALPADTRVCIVKHANVVISVVEVLSGPI